MRGLFFMIALINLEIGNIEIQGKNKRRITQLFTANHSANFSPFVRMA